MYKLLCTCSSNICLICIEFQKTSYTYELKNNNEKDKSFSIVPNLIYFWVVLNIIIFSNKSYSCNYIHGLTTNWRLEVAMILSIFYQPFYKY